jgi:hypothetical protein
MTGLLRNLLLLAAPLFGLGALALYNGASWRVASAASAVAVDQDLELVDQPPYWVPFSAELKKIDERDGSIFVGRSYRASDGSTRNETGRSFDRITSIAIKNIPQATFYLWNTRQGWTSQPMDLPPGGLATPRARVFNRHNMTEVDDTVEGLKLIRLETGARALYQAPELNLYTLVILVKCTYDPGAACGTWHSNIKVGEQPVEYFLPPPDAQVLYVDTPGGIVKKEPSARQR